MSDDKKVRLPASAGGIMQYYDEYKSKISVSPWTVVIATVVVIVLVILMHVLSKTK